MPVSNSVLWLLLFVVIVAAVLFVAVTRTRFTTQKLALIGVMAALSFVAYEFFRIPFFEQRFLLPPGQYLHRADRLAAGRRFRAGWPARSGWRWPTWWPATPATR